MSYYVMVQGSIKHRRWMKKSVRLRRAAQNRELAQFERREHGWLYIWDEEDSVSYAHHWLEHKPVIHKGRKARG